MLGLRMARHNLNRPRGEILRQMAVIEQTIAEVRQKPRSTQTVAKIERLKTQLRKLEARFLT